MIPLVHWRSHAVNPTRATTPGTWACAVPIGGEFLKFDLPEGHSLSEASVARLVFTQDGSPALTDAQHAALEAGVGRGQSMLVTSPTSTGKTQIALWAIARSLESGYRTVYLVTHRALAKQKFQDFNTLLTEGFLGNDPASLVLSTGDTTENGLGNPPSDPLSAPLLVATYEKYLALLSASGVPTDMGSTVIVCDEIQLLGDKNRGQNVEVLLTVLRNAGWRQLVGLSAVLNPTDARDLAHWLDVSLVAQHNREKHLRFECWSPSGVASASTDNPDNIEEGGPIPRGGGPSTLEALAVLLKETPPPTPAIVFCMTKKATYDLAKAFGNERPDKKEQQLSLAFDELPETAANSLLSRLLHKRTAFHNADLTDEEREIVEEHLLQGKLDVVFATSTLAAGVNFPLGAAVFDKWTRWNFSRREHEPIGVGEFHNMAGRVGRMGFKHEHGRVILFATSGHQQKIASRYLKLGELPDLEARVSPERFKQFALQLVGSGICDSRSALSKIVLSTFSALREEDSNLKGFQQWPQELADATDALVADGLLVETSSERLVATPVGKSVGHSGLLPDTCLVLLEYLARKAERLTACLPSSGDPGDLDRLAFLLYSACFACPEFRENDGTGPTRFLPWPLDGDALGNPDEFAADLLEPTWQADVAPVNAAWLCREWSNGAVLRDLEESRPNLTAGMLNETQQNLAWVLQGIAAVVASATDVRVLEAMQPTVVRENQSRLPLMGRLPRVMRRLALRVLSGLPDDAIWMLGLNEPDAEFRVTRAEILELRKRNYGSPELVSLGSNEADDARAEVFKRARPSARAKGNWLRDQCRSWKTRQRARATERHAERAKRLNCEEQFEAYYASTGTDFEVAFERLLDEIGIDYERLDDKTRTGAPDYLVNLVDSPPLVFELKTKQKGNLVGYNDAVEVLSASEIHGLREHFCVTLCHPGVDPGVPTEIASCGRLTVVESSDFGEALLRLKASNLSVSQLWQWLASPGQALTSDLPYVDHQPT